MQSSAGHESLHEPSPFSSVDHKAFARDVEALHASLKADLGLADYRHLLKMVWWSRLSTLLGYATAWIMPNPLSALLQASRSNPRPPSPAARI